MSFYDLQLKLCYSKMWMWFRMMNDYTTDTMNWISVAGLSTALPFNIGTVSFTSMDDEDIRVPDHPSACLCKSVNTSLLRPSAKVENWLSALCRVSHYTAVPVVLCHHFNQQFDVLIEVRL